jgi:hypothetical protein
MTAPGDAPRRQTSAEVSVLFGYYDGPSRRRYEAPEDAADRHEGRVII